MKTIIQENQRGFLMKNGVFQRLLSPGKHSYPSFLGYQLRISSMSEDLVDTQDIPLPVLLQNSELKKQTVYLQIPDDSIALHYRDGQFSDVLTDSEYLFWNHLHQHTFRMISLASPYVTPDIPRYAFSDIPANLFRRITVEDGETALLYFDNKLETQLSPGTYYFWNWETKVTHKLFDLKIQQLDISGQEILTADKIGVRLNVTTSYKITDPVSLAATIKDLSGQLYTHIQLIIREYVGRYRLDELLDQKESISHYILDKLQEKQDRCFVEFLFAGIKDIILPGEIRDIMNTVLIAEKKAQANVITRREEVASTRSLLSTAKLMDENATLCKLKELEYLERICDRVDTISLSGADSVLRQLGKLVSSN